MHLCIYEIQVDVNKSLHDIWITHCTKTNKLNDIWQIRQHFIKTTALISRWTDCGSGPIFDRGQGHSQSSDCLPLHHSITMHNTSDFKINISLVITFYSTHKKSNWTNEDILRFQCLSSLSSSSSRFHFCFHAKKCWSSILYSVVIASSNSSVYLSYCQLSSSTVIIYQSHTCT